MRLKGVLFLKISGNTVSRSVEKAVPSRSVIKISTNLPRFLLAGFLAFGGPVIAQTAAAPSDETDDIPANLERTDETSAAEGMGTLERISELRKKWREAIGLDYSVSAFSYAAGMLGGDGAQVDASGELVLQGIWAPGKRWRDNPVELRFRVRDRRGVGGGSPASLGKEEGTLWGIADGFTDAGFQVPDFYFRHVFTRNGTELRYGQMTIDSQFDSYALRGAKQSFLNQAFATNPSVAFPSYGAGLTLARKFDNGISFAIGASNVQGTRTDEHNVDIRFDSKDLFECAQVSYDFKRCGDNASRIELMAWHSDAVRSTGFEEGQGLSLIFEEEITEWDMRGFARLSASDGGAATVNLFASGGLAVKMTDVDLAGLAVGIGRGAETGNPVQSVLEAFYRWQPREGLRITPDFQLILGQGLVGTPGCRWVAGVRAGIDF